MDLAPELAKEPVAHDLLGQAERHDEDAEGQVGQGQGGHKPVLDALQGVLEEDGDDDDGVAADDHGHQEDGGDGNGVHLGTKNNGPILNWDRL